jgi:hypothetical protein
MPITFSAAPPGPLRRPYSAPATIAGAAAASGRRVGALITEACQ